MALAKCLSYVHFRPRAPNGAVRTDAALDHGHEVREMEPERFDIDLLESKPFKTTNATLRLCFSDTLTYQKRSISNSN